MPDQDRKLLSMVTRQADHARCGLFATDDAAHPLMIAEQNPDGGFAFATAYLVPLAEAVEIQAQLHSPAGKH